MTDRVDPAVEEAVAGGGQARVIVTFDRPRDLEDLAPYHVLFNLASINAATLRIDQADLDRLRSDEHVVRIEADTEIRAFD